MINDLSLPIQETAPEPILSVVSTYICLLKAGMDP
jgi:hypothetical protein